MSDENRMKAKCERFPGRCDFESNNFCGWTRGQEADYSWDISKSNPTDYYYGVYVNRDHTKNSVTGRFLYFSNSFRSQGRVARLASKVIEVADSSCKFRFFYTYGTIFNSTRYDQMTDIGSLTVYLRRDEVNVWKTLFVAREPPGQYYEKVAIPLSEIKEPFEIIIESRTGTTTIKGGWAVDDVSFTSGCTLSNKTLPLSIVEPTEKPVDGCNADQFYCASDKSCIDSEKVCDFVPDCSDSSDEAKCGTCTFDDDKNPTCGWSDFRGGKWKRVKGPQGNNGLTSGVTDGGFYMYVTKETSGSISSIADLRSVDFHDASSTCEVTFYYFMSGISNGDTTLKLQLQTNKKEDVPLWEEVSDQGTKWQNATVSIGSRDAGWHLDFIATHVLSKGDIAIDDIEFLLCAPPFKRKCANKLEFSCLSGECIDKNLVCDFSQDCPDGSDELNCTAYYERCDFEKGDFCGWSQDKGRDAKWNLTSGSELTENSGPARDHTKGNELGKFLITRKGTRWYYNYESQITSTAFIADTSGECKIRFWKHLYESYEAKITVYMKYAEDYRLRTISTVYGSPGDMWERVEIPLKGKFNFQVILGGSPASGRKGEVAIDDISFTPQCIPVYTIITTPIPTVQSKFVCERNGEFTCDDNSCVPFDAVCDFKVDCPYGKDERSCPAFCDFELGSTCGWNAITWKGDGVEINVTIASDAKYIYRNAPKVDKTTNSSDGSYMIIHTSLESETGPLDEYVSPSFRESAAPCKFSLWYAASLLYMRPVITLKTENESVVLTSFVKSLTWRREEMGLGRQIGNFSISINKKGRMGLYDYLAVDDIEFINCALPQKEKGICHGHRCKVRKGCVDYSRICDLTDDCGDRTDEEECDTLGYFSTDFEKGFGIFRPLVHERYAPLSWEIKNGSSRGQGPTFDHTLSNQNGRYVTMGRSINGATNERAWLVSDVVRSLMKGDCQMRFYYFMYGGKVNQLNIYTRTKQTFDMNKLWSQSRESGNFWMRGRIVINETTPFEVVIEGKAGATMSDIIGLDDISFTPGCQQLKSATLPPEEVTGTGSTTTSIPSSCKADEFFCVEDKLCIPDIKRCDFREDCPDKSDEKGCVQSTCDFKDKNMCGWEVTHKFKNVTTRFRRDIDDDTLFQWIPIQANDPLTEVGGQNKPKTDHTTNSADGWYLLADGKPGRSGDTTSLVSPEISFTNAQCAVDFWVYCSMFGCNLKVHTGKLGAMTKVWDANINMRQIYYNRNWVHARALLSSLTKFRVQFVATRHYYPSSAMAMDDISFENCPPPTRVDPEETTCDGAQFMCKNGFCIPENLMCDYNDDCTDFSEERDSRCSAYVARCNFEPKVCPEWHLEADGTARWTLTAPSAASYAYVPKTDHTSKSVDGKFLTAISGYYMQNKKPKLYSDAINGHSEHCKVRFWYNSVSQIKVLVYLRTSYNTDGMKLLADFGSDIGDYWHRAEFEVPDTDQKDYQIVFEAGLTRISGSISIDDISLTSDCHLAVGRDIPGKPTAEPPIDDCAPERFSCKNGECYTHLQRCNFIDDCGDNTDEQDCGTSCTFEKDLCGWYNAPGTKAIWNITKAGSKYYFDIVPKDHTKDDDSGHFVTPKGFTTNKEVAQLITQPYVVSGGSCKMTFWYFMHAWNKKSDPGTLSVFLHKKSTKHETIFERHGVTEEIKWYSATVAINTQEYFSIGIEAQFGGVYYTTIGVDDIEFKECSSKHPPVECTRNEWMCKDIPQCIKIWNHCDGAYNCEDKSDELECHTQYGDCNFDSDKWMSECNWESKNLDFEWSRANEGRSTETGPLRNHNPRQTGYFLYIDTSKQDTGDRAGLTTPTFKASEGKCHLRFWYSMKGSRSLGTLEVFSDSEKGQIFPVFTKRGHQGDDWIFGHAEVGNDHDYRISFVATKGGDNKTDIAIDEVSFTSGCEDGGEAIVPTGPTVLCTSDQFRCKSGEVKCILKAWKCDCARDCSDGSDEENCGITCLTTSDPKIMSSTTPQSTTKESTETPIPQKHCEKGFKLCNDEEKCIPGLLLCDGVKDCKDGSDESYGCNKASACGEGFYFCRDRAYPPCVAREKVCDKKNDCSDGSDESLCDKCTDTFCQNGGECSVKDSKLLCKCKPNFYHNRCSRSTISPELEERLRAQNAGVGWIIGVVIGTILLIAIMFIIWYKRNTNAERTRLPHAVDNPVYGLNLDTLTFGELNTHMPVRREDGAGATAIENPLYAFKSEIK